MNSENISIHCHTCSSTDMTTLTHFSSLKRVTSDCQPWPEGGSLAKCNNCGLVQKIIDQKWQEEIKNIYEQYQIYHQAQGSEQIVFDNVSNAFSSRSQVLVEKLIKEVKLPQKGALLDVGCGNGAFLQAFSNVCPEWVLMGSELDDKNKILIEKIPAVQKLHVGDLDNLNDQFDVISFIHVLEHIPSPTALLKSLRKKFTPTGLLLIQVPYFVDNPFDLVIADHCSHFTPQTLSKIIQEAGYTISLLRTDIITKEITLVASCSDKLELPIDRTCESDTHPYDKDDSIKALQFLTESLNLFSTQQEKACSQKQLFGVFGTSIAAVWLCSSLARPPDFFIDEDTNRIGSSLYNIPILPPNDVPQDAVICIPLAPEVAYTVYERYKEKFTNLIKI